MKRIALFVFTYMFLGVVVLKRLILFAFKYMILVAIVLVGYTIISEGPSEIIMALQGPPEIIVEEHSEQTQTKSKNFVNCDHLYDKIETMLPYTCVLWKDSIEFSRQRRDREKSLRLYKKHCRTV